MGIISAHSVCKKTKRGNWQKEAKLIWYYYYSPLEKSAKMNFMSLSY